MMPTPNAAFRIPHSALPHGISLIEVLISIFIISIGILGVAALLPLAEHMAARGLTADRAAIGGKEALRQFHIREMNNPDNWLFAGGGAFDLDPHLLDPPDPTNPNDPALNWPLQPLGHKAYCIDPRLIARNNTATANTFPIGGTPKMPRITLRRESGGLAAGGTVMTTIMADEVFMLKDDLNFVAAEGETTPPLQTTFKHDNGTPADKSDDTLPIKRFTDGDYSWLATLVRENDGDRYTLTVVIIYKRRFPQGPPPLADDLSIPAGSVIMYGGIGGGEIKITHANAANANLVPGAWVMLSGEGVVGADTVRHYRWYRIIQSSDFETSTNERYVTLAGRDWDTTNFPNPQLTIVPGAIAGYERTIRLETSSLWSR